MKKGLTKNERRVLYGLIRHPTLNDRQLAEQTKVKHSTITAIRRRLHHDGYFKTVRIPAANRLGYELIVVGFGHFDASASDDLRQKLLETLQKENKGLYFFLTSPDYYFFVSATKDYTTFKRWSDAINLAFADTRLFRNTSKSHVIMPFATTRIVKHFDYAAPLRLQFGIRDRYSADLPMSKVDTRRLTKKEKIVLTGLVNYPELTDVALSEKINASRQVISSMKKRFENTGLIRTIRTVDLEKLGYEIYAFGRLRFGASSPLKVRSEGIQKAAQDVPQFLNFSGNYETVACSAFRSYDEFFKTRKEIMAFYSGRDFLVEAPLADLIALSEANIPVHCDFSGLMEEALGKHSKWSE